MLSSPFTAGRKSRPANSKISGYNYGTVYGMCRCSHTFRKMDSLSSQWLDAHGLGMHAGQLASAGFVTLKSAQLSRGMTFAGWGSPTTWNFTLSCKRLRGRSEDEVVQELPVSVVHPEPIIMFSQS